MLGLVAAVLNLVTMVMGLLVRMLIAVAEGL